MNKLRLLLVVLLVLIAVIVIFSADKGRDADHYTAAASEVFLPERIEQVFGITGFSGKPMRENFLLPLGRSTKDRKS